MDETQRWLTAWFDRRGHKIDWGKDAGADLLQAGWVDSFGLVELIEDLEANLGIRFNEADLADPRMVNLQGMAEVASQRRKAGLAT